MLLSWKHPTAPASILIMLVEVVTQPRLCCMMIWFLCPQDQEVTALYRSYGALCWSENIQQQLRPCFNDNDIDFHAIVHAVEFWMDSWMSIAYADLGDKVLMVILFSRWASSLEYSSREASPLFWKTLSSLARVERRGLLMVSSCCSQQRLYYYYDVKESNSLEYVPALGCRIWSWIQFGWVQLD